MSTIDTIDIHDEVNRLSDIDDVERLTAKEVIDLFAYFVNNDKLPEVVKGLIKCKNDKYKLMFLRKMLTSGQSFPTLDSLKGVMENIVDLKVSSLDFKMEQRTFVTGTEKGAFVKEKGIHTEFPLDLLRVAKGVDAEDENAVQQYFMSECKELEKFANVQNRLTVVESSRTTQKKHTSNLPEFTEKSSFKKQKTSNNNGKSPTTLKKLIKELTIETAICVKPSQIIQDFIISMPQASYLYMPNKRVLRKQISRIRTENMTPQPQSLQNVDVLTNLHVTISEEPFLIKELTFNEENIL
ncbi:19798_t:CDS:2 [Rhizophagus irregularis]|nr:19798_t:CDS:2 [Rhizophagus irregularis]